jgi:hypothetical protein
MIRGRSLRRVAGLLACACVAVAGAAPTTAGAQSAVDEYTLDIPGAGGSSSGQGAPPSGAPTGAAPSDVAPSGAASASAGTGGGRPGSESAAGGSAGSGNGSSEARNRDARRLELYALHAGVVDANTAAQPARRSAPEVVADTLLDGAMLPLLAALVVITGIGAWRLLRHRHTPTGATG